MKTLSKNIEKYIHNYELFRSSAFNRLTAEYPVDEYLENMLKSLHKRSYNYISPKIKNVYDSIIESNGFHLYALYQKYAILTFILYSISNIDKIVLPSNIKCLYENWFSRIFEDQNILKDEYYCYENDEFQKDLSVCIQKLLPVGGCWVIEASGAMDRNYFTSAGIMQFINSLKIILRKPYGRKRFYLIHTVKKYIDKFTEKELEKSYLNIADILKRNKKMKGLIRSSWFIDPQIDRVSPRLSYIRKTPEMNGAILFRIGTKATDIQLATLKSPTRRKMYREGLYLPVRHAYVWHRESLIKWADKKKTD